MGFDRNLLPDPASYFESQGLKLIGPRSSVWKTTECRFHGGSDSMRINTKKGTWVCMAGCGARGGDVLSYHIASHGVNFIQAAKELGAYVDDGQTPRRHKANLFSKSDALEVLCFESTLIAIAVANINWVVLPACDKERVLIAASRINKVMDYFK